MFQMFDQLIDLLAKDKTNNGYTNHINDHHNHNSHELGAVLGMFIVGLTFMVVMIHMHHYTTTISFCPFQKPLLKFFAAINPPNLSTQTFIFIIH